MVPNMMTYIIISFSLAITGAIYAQVGLCLPRSCALLRTIRQMIVGGWPRGAPFEGSIWYIMSPIVVIAVFQLAVIFMTPAGDGL
jgi:peptide/nickel transport system permease protein